MLAEPLIFEFTVVGLVFEIESVSLENDIIYSLIVAVLIVLAAAPSHHPTHKRITSLLLPFQKHLEQLLLFAIVQHYLFA